ncbi:MAG TPA: hypothetical protein VGM90_37270 [Kofleriaceae bacterium]|jgi:hypothetical protein
MKLLSATIFGAVVLAAAPAFAFDHQMRVSEVLLSGTANADSQFVEMLDPGGEAFSGNGYNFVIFDASGVVMTSQPIIPTAQTARFVLANTSAQSEFSLTTGEDINNHVIIVNLANTLPAVGAACFRRQDGGNGGAGTLIHCLGWGNATSFPIGVSGTDHGDAPPAGMSLQRYLQCTLVGPPSPNATNTGTCPVAGDNTVPPPDASDPIPDGGTDAGDDNPDNGKGGGGCTVDTSAGWLGCVGLAGLVIAGGALRRRKR